MNFLSSFVGCPWGDITTGVPENAENSQLNWHPEKRGDPLPFRDAGFSMASEEKETAPCGLAA
jgi:hypothetical protein